MSHDYSHQSTKEDPRMMAFFDSLVQREIEGWLSEDESFESQLTYIIGDDESAVSPPPPEATIAPTAHELANNEEPALPYISEESDTVMSGESFFLIISIHFLIAFFIRRFCCAYFITLCCFK